VWKICNKTLQLVGLLHFVDTVYFSSFGIHFYFCLHRQCAFCLWRCLINHSITKNKQVNIGKDNAIFRRLIAVSIHSACFTAAAAAAAGAAKFELFYWCVSISTWRHYRWRHTDSNSGNWSYPADCFRNTDVRMRLNEKRLGSY